MDQDQLNEVKEALKVAGVPERALRSWNGKPLLVLHPGNGDERPWRVQLDDDERFPIGNGVRVLLALKESELDYIQGERTKRLSRGGVREIFFQTVEKEPRRKYEAIIRCMCGTRHTWLSRPAADTTATVTCADCGEDQTLDLTTAKRSVIQRFKDDEVAG